MKKKVKKQSSSIFQNEEFIGYLFIAPFVIGYSIFIAIPILATFLLSFMDVNTFNKMCNLTMAKYYGINNFINALKDSGFRISLINSMTFTIIYVPTLVISSLLLAMLLNREFFLKKVATTMVFMPYVTNVAVLALIMGGLFLAPFDGTVNTILKMIGIHNPPMWLAGIHTVLPTVAVVSAWQALAFQCIIFIVALNEVNKELYEAADIDGCNRIQRFFKITLPLISPTTFIVIITAIIQSFSNYGIIKTFTNGGPGNASTTLIFNIISTSFVYNRYSFAAAQAVIQFIIVLTITIVQWRWQKKWVNY